MRGAIGLLIVLLAGEVCGATLQPAGVIGNSGVADDGLVRCTDVTTPGGVWLDEDLTLWLNGGDAINHLSFSGACLERFPLAPACDRVQSGSFAALDGALYFLGLAPPTKTHRTNNAALFRLPMQPDGIVELAVRLPLTNPRSIGAIAPHPIDGRLLLGLNRKDPHNDAVRPGLYTWSPTDDELQRFSELRPENIAGIGMDPQRGWIYVGGYFGQYRPSFAHHPNVTEFVRLDHKGSELNRRDMFTMEAIPSQFNGWLSYGGDALWAFAWYGFTGRMAPDTLASAPGKVTGWDLRLNLPTQVIGVRDVAKLAEPTLQARRFDPLIVTTNRPAFTYFARWDHRHRQLELVDRLGSLPAVDSLTLGEDGWLAVGVPDWQTWWRWEDGPASPPRHAGIGSALTGGVYVDDMLIAIQRPRHGRWQLGEPNDFTVNGFIHATGRHTSQDITEAPIRLPAGFEAYLTPRADGSGSSGVAYILDAATGALWQATVAVHSTRANVGPWEEVVIDGGQLDTPGDVAALGVDLLAVADGSDVVLLQRTGDSSFRVWHRLNAWGDDPQAQFGRQLRLDGEGATLLIADTDRHRVLWLDVPTRRVVAQFGDTDKPGAGTLALDGPTVTTLCGHRAVVYDSNNQRLVKLMLEP